jgi:hypothetical protein
MLRDFDAPDLVCPAGIGEGGEPPSPRGHIGKAGGLAHHVKIVGWCKTWPAIIGLASQNGNQPIRFWERIRVQRQRIDDSKQRGVCADPERQSKNG